MVPRSLEVVIATEEPPLDVFEELTQFRRIMERPHSVSGRVTIMCY